MGRLSSTYQLVGRIAFQRACMSNMCQVSWTSVQIRARTIAGSIFLHCYGCASLSANAHVLAPNNSKFALPGAETLPAVGACTAAPRAQHTPISCVAAVWYMFLHVLVQLPYVVMCLGQYEVVRIAVIHTLQMFRRHPRLTGSSAQVTGNISLMMCLRQQHIFMPVQDIQMPLRRTGRNRKNLSR